MDDYIYLTTEEIKEIHQKIFDHNEEITDAVIANCVLPEFNLISDQSTTGISLTEYCLNETGLRVRANKDLMYELEFVSASPLDAYQGAKAQVRVPKDCPPIYRAWLNEKNALGIENWKNTAFPFFIINYYLLHYEQTDVLQKETKTLMQSVPSKKHGTSYIARTYKCYTLKKNWKRAKKRKIEISCPAWGVRGHYRHYADGRVVFIKAYVKGKEKDKYQGKEYRILPKKKGSDPHDM